MLQGRKEMKGERRDCEKKERKLNRGEIQKKAEKKGQEKKSREERWNKLQEWNNEIEKKKMKGWMIVCGKKKKSET